MEKIHNVIYVPGVGDNKRTGSKAIPALWRMHGLKMHYLPMDWAKGNYQPKHNRVLHFVDRLLEKGELVSMIGISAGGSEVVHTLAARQNDITAAVLVCAKARNIDLVTPNRRLDENPAYRESLELLPLSIESLLPETLGRMLVYRPLQDSVIPPQDTHIDGVRDKLILSAGHPTSIGVAITVGSFGMAHFIKQQQAA